MSLEGKVCVVTGSGGGIGRATAVEMARQGARVVVSDIDDDRGQETVGLVAEEGGKATYFHADMRSASDISGLMEHAVRTFGRLDVLHNNAGVHESSFVREGMTVDALPIEVWDAVIEINLKGAWLAARAAFPHMRESGGGAIVNAGSTASLAGYPMCPAYTATKHAIVGLTKCMAIDFREAGIRANCYCPASIDTAMVAGFWESADDPELVRSFMAASHLYPKRLGRPEEVAKLVCFLASDDASFINGATILIDAGSLAWRGSD